MKKGSYLNGYNDTLSGLDLLFNLASIIISSLRDLIKMIKNEELVA